MKRYYPKNGRVILHVDMNSFFASVEMAYDPSLKGKPLAIAGAAKQRKGIVVTCSYEARKFGVKTTMPVWEAKKLCPQLIIRPPHFERYRKASKAMFDILNQYSSLVEPVSIDEGYLDITACYKMGTPYEIALMIQQSLRKQLDLPCSIGIAPNKFLAKMASDMKKPLGITILRKRDVPAKLWPLSVIEMHGVGKKTSKKLRKMQVMTIKDLANADEIQLRKILGIRGSRLKARANGIDERPVDPEAAKESKSIGSSTTLSRDLSNKQELLKVLAQLSRKTSVRLKRKKYVATNIAITIRYHHRKTITRSRMLPNPIVNEEDIYRAAQTLFIEHWNREPVRLLGVTGHDLVEQRYAYEQLDLFTFTEAAKKEPLNQAIDSLQKKFGKSIIHKGAHNIDRNAK